MVDSGGMSHLIGRLGGMLHVKLDTDLIAKVTQLDSVGSLRLGMAERFSGLLLEANRQINLVSRAGSVEREIERQLLLSLAVLPRLPTDGSLHWIDVGSGGGFPAIPLAIFRPDDRFDLVESVAKKAFFLERTIDALSLTNAKVRNCRVQALIARDGAREHLYNWMSIKAVSRWEENLDWGGALLEHGGCFVTYKPSNPSEADLKLAKSRGFELNDSLSIDGIIHDISTKIIVMKKS
jgi:16S rRNA (guanine(527)-N(7))-methyltransferase RsmG